MKRIGKIREMRMNHNKIVEVNTKQKKKMKMRIMWRYCQKRFKTSLIKVQEPQSPQRPSVTTIRKKHLILELSQNLMIQSRR